MAAFGDCFAEDAEWRIGGVVVLGRTNIVTHMNNVFAKFKLILVTTRTPILDVGNGTASGRTYLTEHGIFADGTAIAPIGIYYERFVQQGDRWRFAWRLFQTKYVGPADMSGAFYDNADFGAPPGMPPLDQETNNYTGMHKAKD
jgi:hypothetical protein